MRLKIRNIPFLLISAGFFFTPFGIRNVIIPEYAGINFLAYLGLVLGIYFGIFYRRHFSKKNLYLIIAVLLMCFLMFYVEGNGWSQANKLKRLFVYVFPLFFVFVDFKNENNFSSSLSIWYRVLKFVSYFMITAYVLDLFLGYRIASYICQIYNSKSVNVNSGRFISIYGHPLETSMIFLVFLMWTLILFETDSNNIKNKIIDVTVSLFGIAVCGSKLALFLSLLILLLYFDLRKIKYLKYFILILLAALILYSTGIFDLTLDRFIEGIQNGDLSTTRNYYLSYLISNNTITFDWTHGHIFNPQITGMTAALEYPVISFAYMCGILFTVCVYITYFIIPLIFGMRIKNKKMIMCFMILLVFVQCNNGICSMSDDLLFYSINCGLFLQFLKWNYEFNTGDY